jgi:hypothetical protein
MAFRVENTSVVNVTATGGLLTGRTVGRTFLHAQASGFDEDTNVRTDCLPNKELLSDLVRSGSCTGRPRWRWS